MTTVVTAACAGPSDIRPQIFPGDYLLSLCIVNTQLMIKFSNTARREQQLFILCNLAAHTSDSVIFFLSLNLRYILFETIECETARRHFQQKKILLGPSPHIMLLCNKCNISSQLPPPLQQLIAGGSGEEFFNSIPWMTLATRKS